jgi:hypothetical protein
VEELDMMMNFLEDVKVLDDHNVNVDLVLLLLLLLLLFEFFQELLLVLVFAVV